MGDDIDDLLDEVEAAFVKKHTIKKIKNRYSQEDNSTQTRMKSRPKDDELDNLMSEICDIPDPMPAQQILSPAPTLARSDQKQRCFTIYLGGSAHSEGITTTASQRACDRLRCTDCDFKVSVYKDFKWDPSTDYLFLRNNMPDFSRLRAKLIPRTGYKAYACQCQWRNIDKLTELSQSKDLKWVCGKHP
ncbi:cilia- and flagella-associated protein 418-like [Watersipora subatra]|uniref:cilia- and flagella-associated protein 418-like n=1 Tax=Watersipora subatra TaxID=2589382 RepID=UPI00355BBF16